MTVSENFSRNAMYNEAVSKIAMLPDFNLREVTEGHVIWSDGVIKITFSYCIFDESVSIRYSTWTRFTPTENFTDINGGLNRLSLELGEKVIHIGNMTEGI